VLSVWIPGRWERGFVRSVCGRSRMLRASYILEQEQADQTAPRSRHPGIQKRNLLSETPLFKMINPYCLILS